MRNDLQEARKTFPKMPEEVFTLWLDGRILTKGWPPLGIEWQGFLLGHPIDFWQRLDWIKQDVNLSWDSLGPTSQLIMRSLIDGNINGRSNLVTTYVPDSKIRFQHSMKYILEHGTTPSTLVLRDENNHYEVIDGNHRVAALVALQSHKSTKEKVISPQLAWIGELNTAEPAPAYGVNAAAEP